MKYSASTGGLYDPVLHENIPADAVDLTDGDYQRLKGQAISPDSQGRPVLCDIQHPDLTVAQVQAARRSAYRSQSDSLKFEAEHDALVAGAEPDYSAWLSAVAEIKARYPLPA